AARLPRLLDYYRHPPRERLIQSLLGARNAKRVADRFEAQYSAVKDLRQVEVELRLPRLLLRADVCLMARSIEGRVPFLHNRIPAMAMSLPFTSLTAEGGKSVLRTAYARELGARASSPKIRFKGSDAMLKGFIR